MPSNTSELLDRYRHGDQTAATELFDRYVRRLLALAQSRLSSRLTRRVDADDIVQSAYRSFFVRVRAGEFSVGSDDDLWRLLATITLHKLWRAAKHHRAKKRAMQDELVLGAEAGWTLDQVVDREPSVADVIVAGDELHWLYAQLDPVERQALELRLQEIAPAEIAARLNRSERTVRRYLANARALLEQRWEQARDDDRGAKTDSRKLLHSTPGHAAVNAPLRYADYRLRRLIGAGGMSKVFEAVHIATGKSVAFKVLRKRLLRHPQIVQHFLREASIVGQLHYAHLVRVHGVGQLPDQNYFLILDFIDGQDLQHVIDAGRMSVSQAVEIVCVVADTIQHAHEHGVIHRDLKPGNVLIDRQGTVFVTDFGLAQIRGDNPVDAIAGTKGFMAPEQLNPDLGPTGPHTDVYGLGALLHTLCYGQAPARFAELEPSHTVTTNGRHGVVPKSTCQVVQDAIANICQRCLAPNWQKRFQSAAEVAAALRSVQIQQNP